MLNNLEDRMDKASLELKQRQQRLSDLERRLKEEQKECEMFREANKKINERVAQLNYEKKKMEDDLKKEKERDKKEGRVMVNDKDKEKFKKIVEDNYRMKFKMQELLAQVKALDKENKQAMDKFKNFINNSGLTDEQKRMLLAKADELFTLDLSSKLNIRELEVMSKVDNEMLKDPMIRAMIGDPIAMVKKLKLEEKEKIAKRADPSYSQDFDPNLLEDGQKIMIRKVKKKVKVLNANGEWVDQVRGRRVCVCLGPC